MADSSFTYKGRAVHVKQVGRELGVRYVLEGSVRKAATRVRIAAQLIEAESGVHVWADRYEGSLEDIFAVQDELTASLLGALGPQLEKAEIARAKRKRLTNLDAYDLFLRGLATMRTLTPEGVEEAFPRPLIRWGQDRTPRMPRAATILDAMAAERMVIEIELIPDLLVNGMGDANGARLGESLEACSGSSGLAAESGPL
jgi:hypothetical protein